MLTRSSLAQGAVFQSGWTERAVKPEQHYSDSFVVKVLKQPLICSVGASQGRACILTSVFDSQWSSLPSPLICCRSLQGCAGWEKHLALHEGIRKGGAICDQPVLLLPGQ